MKALTALTLAVLLLAGTSLLLLELVKWEGYCRTMGIPLIV